METLLGCLAIIGAAFMFGVVLNPFFWEGVRNRKFRDEQKKANTKNLVALDNADV